MIEWIDATHQLPEDGEWVIAYFPERPWGSGDEVWKHKCKVVKFVRGLSDEERDKLRETDPKSARIYRRGDIHGNNKVPYAWEEFGPGSFFGQECEKWARLDMEDK